MTPALTILLATLGVAATWLLLAALTLRWNRARGRTHRWVCHVCHHQADSDAGLEAHLAEHETSRRPA